MASPPLARRRSARPYRRASAPRRGWRESARVLLLLALAALLVRCIVAVRSIPSESMLPGLLPGDYLLVAEWPYGWSQFSLPGAPRLFAGRILPHAPKRGDVVVFRAPPADREDYVKRLIGLPGDRIQIRHGMLILNGTAVPRTRLADFVTPITANTHCNSIAVAPYGPVTEHGRAVCRFPLYRETLPGGRSYTVIDQGRSMGDDTPVFTVPSGHYFMLGDNRDMSLDSRFTPDEGGIAMVPFVNLEGRALTLLFSTQGSARWYDPMSWWRALRPHRGLAAQ